MPTYATAAELKAFSSLPAIDALDNAALDALLEAAERDIDNAVGVRDRNEATGLKFAPAELDANPKRSLRDATCAQAEYRHVMGPEFFVRAQHAKVSGPEFTTEGILPTLAPAAWDALAGTELLRLTTSWRGVGSDPPWRDFAYG